MQPQQRRVRREAPAPQIVRPARRNTFAPAAALTSTGRDPRRLPRADVAGQRVPRPARPVANADRTRAVQAKLLANKEYFDDLVTSPRDPAKSKERHERFSSQAEADRFVRLASQEESRITAANLSSIRGGRPGRPLATIAGHGAVIRSHAPAR